MCQTDKCVVAQGLKVVPIINLITIDHSRMIPCLEAVQCPLPIFYNKNIFLKPGTPVHSVIFVVFTINNTVTLCILPCNKLITFLHTTQ